MYPRIAPDLQAATSAAAAAEALTESGPASGIRPGPTATVAAAIPSPAELTRIAARMHLLAQSVKQIDRSSISFLPALLAAPR